MLICMVLPVRLRISFWNNNDNFKNSVSDKEIETMSVILDRSIVSYYTNHFGELPPALNDDVIKIMGLEDMVDLDYFTYTRTSDNTFRLEAKLSTGNVQSAHSGEALVIIEPEEP